jgi:CheY-like chemotaxis protein
MSDLKILLVEDSEDQQKVFADSVRVFNDRNDGICSVTFEIAQNLPEAESKINGSFDGAIVDLKLGDDNEGGNTVIRKFSETLTRIPVIFVTAFVDLVEDHPSIIRKRTRGSESYESDLNMLKRISDTGLTRIMGGRGVIEKTLSEVFLGNLLPQKDKWVEYGETDSIRTEKALLRHALNHLLHLLDDDGEKCFPEEVYLYPPLTDRIRTGSLVKGKDSDQRFVVMNPACDLVIRGNGNYKTDRILLVEIENKDNVVNLALADIQNVEKKKKKLRIVFCNNYTDYYHWLPRTDFFEGGFLNFRKLSSLSSKEFNERFEKPAVQISPSFVKDMVARFSAYYARQGQPDIDFEYLINLPAVQTGNSQ